MGLGVPAQHRERLLLFLAEPAALGQRRQPLLAALELIEQSAPVVEAVDIEASRESDTVEAEVGGVGVVLDLQGVVPGAEEASVLRIDALVDAGRTREALAQAAAFLLAHPQSAYARRIRAKLARQ